MNPVLYIYAIASFALAVGLSFGWWGVPAANRGWHGGLASGAAWVQFFCILYYILNAHSGA